MERPSLIPPGEILGNFIDYHLNAAQTLREVSVIFTDPTGEFDDEGLLTAMRIVRNAYTNDLGMDDMYKQLDEANLIWADPEVGIQRATLLHSCYSNSNELWNRYLDRLDETPGLSHLP